MSSNKFAVAIQGIPTLFTEQAEPGISGYNQYLSLVELDAGSSKLQIERRRTAGEGLRIKLRDTLGEIRALVQPRKDPVAWLTSNIGAGNTGLVTNVALVTGQDYYIGAETVSGTVSGLTLVSLSRGKYGSEAQGHFGNVNEGQGEFVYSAAPAWTGRKVTLYHNGVAAGTYRLEAPPQYLGGEMWELDCSAISDWYAQRKILDGVIVGEQKDRISMRSPTQHPRVSDVGNRDTNLLMMFKLDTGATHLVQPDGTGTGDEIGWTDTDLIQPPWERYNEILFTNLAGVQSDIPRWESAQIAVQVQGDAAVECMKLLNSNGSGGDYDVYPRSDAAEFDEPEWQVGAGLDVDLTQFIGQAQWSQVLVKNMTVEEILYEFCLTVGAYWYADEAGEIQVTPLRERIPASESVATITDDVVLISSKDTVNVREDEIYNRVTMKCNYDPLNDQFLAVVNTLDSSIRKLFPEMSRGLEFESKFIHIDVNQFGEVAPGGQRVVAPTSMGRDQVQDMLIRLQRYSMIPRLDYTTKVTFDYKSLRPGQIVSLTNARAPDLKGGTLNGQFLIRERRVNYEDGEIELTLRATEPGFLLAASCEVASVGGTTTTWATTRYSTDLADEIAVGWEVTCPVRGETRTVSQIGASSFRTSVAWSTVVAGDILIFQAGTGTNALGYDQDDIAIQQPDTGGGTRWS